VQNEGNALGIKYRGGRLLPCRQISRRRGGGGVGGGGGGGGEKGMEKIPRRSERRRGELKE